MARNFPNVLETRLLGPLRLDETTISGITTRHYESEQKQTIPGRGSVAVVVWPPSGGVPDPAKLAAFVDGRWERIAAGLESIVAAAEPVVDRALRAFCDPKLRPGTRDSLRSARLDLIKINADGDDELQFHDVMDVIGSHDLLLGLGARLQPTYATFDG